MEHEKIDFVKDGANVFFGFRALKEIEQECGKDTRPLQVEGVCQS